MPEKLVPLIDLGPESKGVENALESLHAWPLGLSGRTLILRVSDPAAAPIHDILERLRQIPNVWERFDDIAFD